MHTAKFFTGLFNWQRLAEAASGIVNGSVTISMYNSVITYPYLTSTPLKFGQGWVIAFTKKHNYTYDYLLQYIPRNMHTIFALLCFVVVMHWLIIPYPSGLLHWHCGNLTIAPVPAKQPWWIWINTSCEFIMNDCITTTKQNTTKPCAYFLGYTVHPALRWTMLVKETPIRFVAIAIADFSCCFCIIHFYHSYIMIYQTILLHYFCISILWYDMICITMHITTYLCAIILVILVIIIVVSSIVIIIIIIIIISS